MMISDRVLIGLSRSPTPVPRSPCGNKRLPIPLAPFQTQFMPSKSDQYHLCINLRSFGFCWFFFARGMRPIEKQGMLTAIGVLRVLCVSYILSLLSCLVFWALPWTHWSTLRSEGNLEVVITHTISPSLCLRPSDYMSPSTEHTELPEPLPHVLLPSRPTSPPLPCRPFIPFPPQAAPIWSGSY